MTQTTSELTHLFRLLKAPAAARALPKLADRSAKPGTVHGASERNALRIVFRDRPVRRASVLIDTPRTKCSRRSSAHSSTSSKTSS